MLTRLGVKSIDSSGLWIVGMTLTADERGVCSSRVVGSTSLGSGATGLERLRRYCTLRVVSSTVDAVTLSVSLWISVERVV